MYTRWATHRNRIHTATVVVLVYVVILGETAVRLNILFGFFLLFVPFYLNDLPSMTIYIQISTCVYSNSLTPQSRQRDYVMANPRNPQAISALDTISSHEGNYYYYYVGMVEIRQVACPAYITILCINIVCIMFKTVTTKTMCSPCNITIITGESDRKFIKLYTIISFLCFRIYVKRFHWSFESRALN